MSRMWMRVGRWRGAPIIVHWTVPVAALALGSFAWAPVLWLSFIALLAVHVAGHAYCARRVGASIRAYYLSGVGGRCRWEGRLSTRQALWIAWGGLGAQVVVGALVWGASGVFGASDSAAGTPGLELWHQANLVLIGLNLLPLPGCDGLEAWGLARQFRAPDAGLHEERGRASHRGGASEDEGLEPWDPAVAEVAREVQQELDRIAAAVRAEASSESASSPEEEHS